ncbi:unnamed protein product [Urochloa humidicola]
MPQTLPASEFFAGTRCYVDAAITPDVQRYNPRQAGLGILIQPQHQDLNRNIFIQGITEQAIDPLQAEAHAITLASAIIKHLNHQQVLYFTDSQLLATTLQHIDPVLHAPDWRTRPAIADFLHNSQDSNFTVKKIPRTRNSTAHTLAAQARAQADVMESIFVCNNPSHGSVCDVLAALQDKQWGIYRLISVSCL